MQTFLNAGSEPVADPQKTAILFMTVDFMGVKNLTGIHSVRFDSIIIEEKQT
jgi:hypothetical protein